MSNFHAFTKSFLLHFLLAGGILFNTCVCTNPKSYVTKFLSSVSGNQIHSYSDKAAETLIKNLVKDKHLKIRCHTDQLHKLQFSQVDQKKFKELVSKDISSYVLKNDQICEFTFHRTVKKTLKEIVHIVWMFGKLKLFSFTKNFQKHHKIIIEISPVVGNMDLVFSVRGNQRQIYIHFEHSNQESYVGVANLMDKKISNSKNVSAVDPSNWCGGSRAPCWQIYVFNSLNSSFTHC